MSYNNSDTNLRKLFLGGLDRNATEDDIRNQFASFGEIEDLVVIRDKQTQESKGFGFITFTTIESTDAALENKRQSKEVKILSKTVEVKRAIPREDQSETGHLKSKQIFVGGIPWSMSEEAVREAITAWAAPTEILKIDLMKKQDDPSKLRGFGFLLFEHEDHVDKLVIQQGLKLGMKMIEVKKAAPRDEMGGGGGRGGGRRGGRGGGGGGGNRGGYGGGYESAGYGNDSYSDGGYSGGYGGSNYSSGGYPSSGGGGYAAGGGGGGSGYSSGGYGGGDYGADYNSGGYDQGSRGGRGGGRYKPY